MKVYVPLLLTLMSFFPPVNAAIIEVCDGCQFSTIADAVKNSVSGDELSIHPGLYEESGLIVNHSLTLSGQPGAELRHSGAEADAILVKAPQTVIRGLKISGSGKSSYHDFAAIKVQDSGECHIHDNEIVNSQYGIMIINSAKCRLINNKIHTSSVPVSLLGDAIHLWKSSEPVIEGNFLQGHRDGIYLEFVENGLIERNRVLKNHRYGLHFMFSSHNVFQANLFSENDAGVAVMYSKNIEMIRNKYHRNHGAASFGLLLKDISDSVIRKNSFSENTVAIFLEGSNRNDFSLNTFDRNGWAMRLLSSCEGNKFTRNAFLKNILEISTNASKSLNSFTENYWAEHVALDLDHDGFADLPYQPTNYSSYLVERYSLAILLLESPFLKILDLLEKNFPALSPVSLRDPKPLMNLPEGLND